MEIHQSLSRSESFPSIISETDRQTGRQADRSNRKLGLSQSLVDRQTPFIKHKMRPRLCRVEVKRNHHDSTNLPGGFEDSDHNQFPKMVL